MPNTVKNSTDQPMKTHIHAAFNPHNKIIVIDTYYYNTVTRISISSNYMHKCLVNMLLFLYFECLNFCFLYIDYDNNTAVKVWIL